MPSKSAAQHRLMAMVANDPAAAKRLGIPQSVGSEFMKADKGRKFAGGGMAKKLFGGKESYAEELKEAKAIKSGKISPQQYARGEQKEEAGMKKMKKFDYGGAIVDTSDIDIKRPPPAPVSKPAPALTSRTAALMRGAAPAAGQARMAKGGMAASKMGKVVAGGKRAHGEHSIQTKGHTKGTMVKMAGGKGMKRGGKC